MYFFDCALTRLRAVEELQPTSCASSPVAAAGTAARGSGVFYLTRRWGRIGCEEIGDGRVEKFATRDEVLLAFRDRFYEKTMNRWDQSEPFQCKIDRFFLVAKTDTVELPVERVANQLNPRTALPLPNIVRDLIGLIFDKTAMETAMVSMKIDTEKLPLGRLCISQLTAAYTVLNKLSQLIDAQQNQQRPTTGGSADSAEEGSRVGCLADLTSQENVSNHTRLLAWTTQFYLLLPHVFARGSRPPLLATRSAIAEKLRLLDDMMEMQRAWQLYQKGNQDNCLYYEQLKADLEPLPFDSALFAQVKKYLCDNHGPTHSGYHLEPVAVFQVTRASEMKRRLPSTNDNRQMLWHGSRTTNWSGIISQGLRIAPPEAPHSGYMFGKGVYFADMASKSANYCNVNPVSPSSLSLSGTSSASSRQGQGLLLLCEVELGSMEECLQANPRVLEDRFKSRKGLGRYQSNESTHITQDGVRWPIGKPIARSVQSRLHYNEFIVYNTDQIRQRYLVWTKFVKN